MELALRDAQGVLEVSEATFGREFNEALVHQYIVNLLARQRQGNAATKERSDVRGGGKKPWRQKGTGRARVGSIRSPLWRSGGTIFGPTTERTYYSKLNRKSALKALKQALTLAEKDGRVLIIDDYQIEDGKTKTAAKVFKNMGVNRGAILVSENTSAKTIQATQNIPFVVLVSQPSLTAYDVLRAHHVIFTKEALKSLEERLKGNK